MSSISYSDISNIWHPLQHKAPITFYDFIHPPLDYNYSFHDDTPTYRISSNTCTGFSLVRDIHIRYVSSTKIKYSKVQEYRWWSNAVVVVRPLWYITWTRGDDTTIYYPEDVPLTWNLTWKFFADFTLKGVDTSTRTILTQNPIYYKYTSMVTSTVEIPMRFSCAEFCHSSYVNLPIQSLRSNLLWFWC